MRKLIEEIKRTIKYVEYNGKVDVLIDDINCFRAIIEWEKCIGEIIVDYPDFAPYRFISFNILASDSEEAKSIYYWLDKDGDSLDFIRAKICEGLEVAEKYSMTSEET